MGIPLYVANFFVLVLLLKFILYHYFLTFLIVMRLCVDLLALIFCMLFAFWVLIFVYFPRLGKLSYYLSIFLLTFLPFLFLRFLYCNCDCNWWCCWIPLTNSNYLFFSFHSGWSFPLLCLPAHSSILLPLLIYYLFPLLYIQFLLLNYLALIF